MTLQPLFNDGAIITLHALAALAGLLLGLSQLILRKGGRRHRSIGYVWISLMVSVAVSSFWIHGFRSFGPFSLIHVLSLLTLVALAFGVRAARVGNMAAHRWSMRSLFFGALVIAGAFTLLPGRVMHAVVMGQ